MGDMSLDYIQCRIGNLELRLNHQKTSLEIVRWNDRHCWMIVSFAKSEETGRHSARFVEDRPLDEGVNWRHLRHLLKAAHDYFAVYLEVDSESL